MSALTSIQCPACAEVLRLRNLKSKEKVLCSVCNACITVVKIVGEEGAPDAFVVAEYRHSGESAEEGVPKIPETIEVVVDELGGAALSASYREKRTLASRFRAIRHWSRGPFGSPWFSFFMVGILSLIAGFNCALRFDILLGLGLVGLSFALYFYCRLRMAVIRARNTSTFSIEAGTFSCCSGPLGFGTRSLSIPLADIERFIVRLQFGSHELLARHRDGSERLIEHRRPLRELQYLCLRLNSHHRTYLHRRRS